MKVSALRWLVGILCASGLVVIFLSQRIDVAGALHIAEASTTKFIINRSIRFLLNDLCAIGLIFALFPFKKYVMFAVYVQIAGMVLFLFPYFLLKYYHPAYNGPLINFLHRLILNPVFLLLLIPAFYYQRTLKH